MKAQMPSSDELGFQMAPMIDIVFLLIIFFMVVAQQSKQQYRPIDNPIATRATITQDPSERGAITVTKDSEIFLGNKQVTAKEITEYVRERSQENAQFKVFLRADASAQHKAVREVMKACAEGGVLDIIFSALQSDK